MKERHIAYQITEAPSSLMCTHAEIEEDRMLDLLIEIQNEHPDGIFWIFKQFGDLPKEPLSIIDCTHNRIYYHYSGEVEELSDAIRKLRL
ncbi:MAG: hypothetical protein M1486_00740 [Gammaproteobacteria bacterium]|nr:hypothetical protein [Gammaproteobacteria bacterium]